MQVYTYTYMLLLDQVA